MGEAEDRVSRMAKVGGTFDAAAYNAAVAEAARREELNGYRRPGGAKAGHHWGVSVSRKEPFVWKVFVEPGMVNDRMAAMSYLRKDDPRGWKMPADWEGLAEMRDYYGGQEPPVVDRLLSERSDRPHLLMSTPSIDGKDAGDMALVDDQARPEAFMSEAMWKKQLWRSIVFLTASPGRYSRVENRLHFPVPAVNRRFRVHLGPKMPNQYPGVAAGGHLALADLFLTRVPGKPELDRLYIRQLCFWSVWTANAETTMDFDPFLPRDAFILPGLAGLTLGPIGMGIVDAVTDLAFQEIARLFEGAATVEFWSAV